MLLELIDSRAALPTYSVSPSTLSITKAPAVPITSSPCDQPAAGFSRAKRSARVGTVAATCAAPLLAPDPSEPPAHAAIGSAYVTASWSDGASIAVGRASVGCSRFAPVGWTCTSDHAARSVSAPTPHGSTRGSRPHARRSSPAARMYDAFETTSSGQPLGSSTTSVSHLQPGPTQAQSPLEGLAQSTTSYRAPVSGSLGSSYTSTSDERCERSSARSDSHQPSVFSVELTSHDGTAARNRVGCTVPVSLSTDERCGGKAPSSDAAKSEKGCGVVPLGAEALLASQSGCHDEAIDAASGGTASIDWRRMFDASSAIEMMPPRIASCTSKLTRYHIPKKDVR